MNHIKKVVLTAITVLKELRLSVKLLLLVAAGAVFAGGSVVFTGRDSFCNSCHVMNPYYDSWQKSTHADVHCLDCHLKPGFGNYVKGKINGMAQAVDCLVGRVGTKPNATVEDSSCLRSACHNTEELTSKQITFKGIKFTHKKHVDKVVDGIEIWCTTCHSHFEGDEHLDVNTQVCFTCHFFKGTAENQVKTNCRACHELPTDVIKRGMVRIDHAEFASYTVNCEDSCHKRQIRKKSEVADNVCLNCHSFSRDRKLTSEELHEAHTGGEKVECFACHGTMSHGPTESISVAAMMDCQNCHSRTHSIQRGIYAAEQPPDDPHDTRILSPMFMTHVECAGCHIEQHQIRYGALESHETVAKAAPRACDACHETGTGQKYIPFWQKKIRRLHKEVADRALRLEEFAEMQTDRQAAARLKARAKQARSILDQVSADGSWGVHNFKYTEAILLKARETVTR